MSHTSGLVTAERGTPRKKARSWVAASRPRVPVQYWRVLDALGELFATVGYEFTADRVGLFAGVSRRTVSRSVAAMKSAGVLALEGGRGRTQGAIWRPLLPAKGSHQIRHEIRHEIRQNDTLSGAVPWRISKPQKSRSETARIRHEMRQNGVFTSPTAPPLGGGPTEKVLNRNPNAEPLDDDDFDDEANAAARTAALAVARAALRPPPRPDRPPSPPSAPDD